VTGTDLACGTVELPAHYSNQPDILHELEQAAQQLQQADGGGVPSVRSVRSPDRKGSVRGLADRLTEAEVRAIVTSFEAGTPRWQLAQQHKTSLSSIARLLRKDRTRPIDA